MTRLLRWPRPRVPSAAATRLPSADLRGRKECPGLVYRRLPPWKREVPRQPRTLPISAVQQLDADLWLALPTEMLELNPVPSHQDPETIPTLAHGLSSVLREVGVHPVDRRHLSARSASGQTDFGENANHDPRHLFSDIMSIPQPDEVNWSVLPPYITASQDETLRANGLRNANVRYCGSTSSLTSILATLYHAVSNFKDTLLVGGLTRHMADLPATFTRMHRHPTAIALRPAPYANAVNSNIQKKEMYAIDSHSGPDLAPPILRDLGHVLERMLTMSESEFKDRMLRKQPCVTASTSHDPGQIKSNAPQSPSKNLASQYYNYTEADAFLIRAQIDCRDQQSDTVFDVKTRAVAAIRYDLRNYLANSHRIIRRLTGLQDSYEREFYDMVRSVFLKYALQLRLGRMSGAFVAYHNTLQLLGFEFVPLEEIEAYVFGSEIWTNHAFSCIVRLLRVILDEAVHGIHLAHPDYLKVVLALRSSQKCVRVYAQVVKGDEGDPLGPDKFSSIGAARVVKAANNFDLSSASVFDDIPGSPMRSGVAVVADDIIGTDVQKLNLGGVGNFSENESTMASTRLAAEDQVFDYAMSKSPNLRVWELSLAHIINGSLVVDPIELQSEDHFEMRYRLSRVDNAEERLVREFVGVLGNLYYPPSRN